MLTFKSFLAEAALHKLPKPGELPIPDDHIRLYHQTSEGAADSIGKEGIKHAHARGIEGPRSIYASETGFYGKPEDKHTVEFHIPKKDWHGNGQIARDIQPHEILAVHHPWHRNARYILDHPNVHAKVLAGQHDNLMGKHPDGSYQYSKEGPAMEYIKKHHKTV